MTLIKIDLEDTTTHSFVNAMNVLDRLAATSKQTEKIAILKETFREPR